MSEDHMTSSWARRQERCRAGWRMCSAAGRQRSASACVTCMALGFCCCVQPGGPAAPAKCALCSAGHQSFCHAQLGVHTVGPPRWSAGADIRAIRWLAVQLPGSCSRTEQARAGGTSSATHRHTLLLCCPFCGMVMHITLIVRRCGKKQDFRCSCPIGAWSEASQNWSRT